MLAARCGTGWRSTSHGVSGSSAATAQSPLNGAPLSNRAGKNGAAAADRARGMDTDATHTGDSAAAADKAPTGDGEGPTRAGAAGSTGASESVSDSLSEAVSGISGASGTTPDSDDEYEAPECATRSVATPRATAP